MEFSCGWFQGESLETVYADIVHDCTGLNVQGFCLELKANKPLF